MTLRFSQNMLVLRQRAQPWLNACVAGFPVWQVTLLVCTLLIGARAALVVQTINHHRVVLLRLADTMAAVNRHSALEWQVISGAFLDKELRQTLQASRTTLQDLRTELADVDRQQTSPVPSVLHLNLPNRDPASTVAVVQLLTALIGAIDQEFALVNQGDLVSARGVHDTLVGPITARLAQAIGVARASRDLQAQRTLNQATVVMVSMIFFFTLTVMTLAQRLLRGQQRAEQLERERQTEREREERDSMTGLWNRRGLQRRYDRWPTDEIMTVLMLDLNRLKAVNDSGGHAAGDAYIRRVALALLEASRPHELVARWGGDEFVALLPAVSEAEAHRVAERTVTLLATPDELRPPFAYGVARCFSGQPLEQALTLADAAMYEHKERQQQDLERLGTGTRLGPTVEEFTVRLEQLETPQDVLQEGLTLARHLLEFNVSAYLERQGEGFALHHLDGLIPETTRTSFVGTSYREASGITARAVMQNATVWSNDYPSEADTLQAWLQLDLKSVIAVPVRYGGRVMGVLVLMQLGSWRVITPQVRRLLEAVARRLGHTYEHAQAVEDIRQAHHGGLLALGVALEERDLETSGHTERVVELSEVLGRRLGLSGSKLEALRQGASLHDIGKLAIPDAVLLKPGALTPDEWHVMQQHAVRGHEIAQRLSGLMPATLDVIRHHHEKWNGGGYPDGLAGETIPLAARIFALCDVYDALTHARPYKRAWSHDETMAEIQRQRDVHFDPVVVDAFVRMVGEETASFLDDTGELLTIGDVLEAS